MHLPKVNPIINNKNRFLQDLDNYEWFCANIFPLNKVIGFPKEFQAQVIFQVNLLILQLTNLVHSLKEAVAMS